MKCGCLCIKREQRLRAAVSLQSMRTYIRRLAVVANNNDDSGGIEASAPRSAGHLCIFSCEKIPERASIMLSSGCEDYGSGRHINTLN
jgi:hypothetical protein